MKWISSLLSTCFCLTVFSSLSNAAVVFTVNSPIAPVTAGTVLNVDIFARGTAGETGSALTTTITLSGGAFTGSPNVDFGGTINNAGVFGQPGFIGAGNLTLGGASSFIYDTTNPNVSVVTLDFVSSQLLPAADQVFARMSIDTAGLAAGPYQIVLSDSSFNGVALSPGNIVSGSFSITAVPEPASILTAGIGMVGLWYGRRRLKVRVAAKS